jgi:formate dehydrogenase gamma subunit
MAAVFCLTAVLAGALAASVAAAAESKPPVACLGCHSALRGKNYLHRERYIGSSHGHLPCLACHNPARIAAIDAVHDDSVPPHGLPAAVPPEGLRSKSAFADALFACGGCHADVYARVQESVHGRAALQEGIAAAAFCTDCHTPIHGLTPRSESSSSVARAQLLETCSRCHANRTIASRYNLNIYVVQSYKAHFHGKKTTLGGQETPTCTVCHGHHGIRAVGDPASAVAGENKVALCARCHPGANPAFASAFTHTPLSSEGHRAAFLVRRVLLILLATTVCLLTVHILLDLYAEVRTRFRPRASPIRPAELPWSLFQSLPRHIERMDIHLRIQHGLMIVAVVYLAASGIALKFPDLRFSQAWINLWGGVENAGHLHRFAALILIIDALYHLLYLLVYALRRRMRFSMLPGRNDVRHLVENIRYLCGRTEVRPRFGKFNYVQKLDYWLVAVVLLVMIVTGLMYWFPTVTIRFLPDSVSPWIWSVVYVTHSTEAFLVLFVSFAWHFYNVHLKSRVFPMSWVWITGWIALDDLREDYPAEFERLVDLESRKANRES